MNMTRLSVSIPYGKGKVMTKWKLISVIMYQFPMGKVKGNQRVKTTVNEKYQFPMGKVKRDDERFGSGTTMAPCINSLWER